MSKNPFFNGGDMDVAPSSSSSCGSKLAAHKTALIIGGAVVGAVLLAILIAVLVVTLSPPPTTSLPATPRGTFFVARGGSRPNGEQRVAARSYDGNPWEALPDQDFTPADVRCDASGAACTVAGGYSVVQMDVPQRLLTVSDRAKAAKFLSQASFGPTRALITTVLARNVSTWISEQMTTVPPTLHRTYYRQRTNPRVQASLQSGAPRDYCLPGSRWNRYAFTSLDEGELVTFAVVGARYTMTVLGVLRGDLTMFLNTSAPANPFNFSLPETRRLCLVTQSVGGLVRLSNASLLCQLGNDRTDVTWANPTIEFANPVGTTTRTLTNSDATFAPVAGKPESLILRTMTAACSGAGQDRFFQISGQYYRHDPRLNLLQNSLESPSDVSASATLTCPSVVSSFVNRAQCVRRAGCAPLIFSSASITLDDTELRAWFTTSSRYVYWVSGLRLESPYAVSPCSGTSRWRHVAGACAVDTALPNATLSPLSTALAASSDTNPYVRDITIAAAPPGCAGAIGASITVGGVCYTHIHPHEFDARDFSYWVTAHDGNDVVMAAGGSNPIARWANAGGVNIQFSLSHPMSRWFDRQALFPRLGRRGDTVDFRGLQTELQTPAMAQRAGSVSTRSAVGFEACGSPGEEANDPLLGHRYQMLDPSPSTSRFRELDWAQDLSTGKNTVWLNAVLSAPDQLRQRCAWALSQIFTISSTGQDRDLGEIEPWIHYYDIFVRHAFGTYRDIVKEVSFSPLMGVYLSYRGNRGYAFALNFPDENYAREIMQLFTIGLWQLNDDGTPILGPDGVNPLPTYTIDNIVDFARVWTGFDFQQPRGNTESPSGANFENVIDPMQLKPVWRDVLPKRKLESAGFLGDEYPLCESLPAQDFLREGATFVYTGVSSAEGAQMDSAAPDSTIGLRGRFTPPTNSALYARLCAPTTVGGPCTFPSRVTLSSNLACTGAVECNAGRVRTVRIVDPVASVTRFYHFRPVPCVRLTFFEEQGRIVRAGSNRQCASPSAWAYPTCCRATTPTTVTSNYTAECLFGNEQTTYAVNEARCANVPSSGLCSGTYTGSANWARTCAANVYQWTSGVCSLKVQVYPSGQIAVVDPAVVVGQRFRVLDQSSNNVFRVIWRDERWPTISSGACSDGCQLVPMATGDTCLCDLAVSSAVVYASVDQVPALWRLQLDLATGAPKPSIFGSLYTQCASTACVARTDVKIWFKSGQPEWSPETILELPPFRTGGRVRYFFNRISTVTVGSKSFRNPPRFMPLAGELNPTQEWTSDALLIPQAENEVEALLDHLVEHNATAPFVAYRLIQRLVTSNPSPRYMRSVVKAFRTGSYEGQIFSGRYGDLAATFTAILLDREARSHILHADPTFGAIREPVLKLLHLLRAMEFRTFDGREVMLPNLFNNIAQEAYRAPSVFGFYLPENRPVGPITDGGLVSPESEITTTPKCVVLERRQFVGVLVSPQRSVINYLNGVVSLIDQGLTSCDLGLGYSVHELGRNCGRANANPDGNFTFVPSSSAPEAIVDELDELLTAGNLNETSRTLMVSEYASVAATSGGSAAALKQLLKIFVASLEFHTNTANIRTNLMRASSTAVKSKGRPFKAIVVIFQNGGADSFNLVVPQAGCVGGKDYYSEYLTVRQGAALTPSQLLPINVPGAQPCNTFGVHSAMPAVKSLYDQGELAFVANVGALVEPVTKDDFLQRSGVAKRYPPSLFAHNIMQRSLQNLHAQVVSSKGILGRTVNALFQQSEPFASELFSLTGNIKMLEGSNAPNMVSSTSGIRRFTQYSRLRSALGNLTQIKASSRLSDTYAELLKNALEKSEALGGLLQAVTLDTVFSTTNDMSRQLSQVAKLIKLRQPLELERAVFVTQSGGWDTHGTFTLDPLFGAIDTAMATFVAEMKAQGVWNDVVVLTVSDFGRTLTSNGAGTDHAWGGNHWIAGGKVKGGQFLGTYPDALTDSGTTNIGRGRVIPTLPWEAMWYGIVKWFGVQDGQLSTVLPNAGNFPASLLFDKDELFKP